MDYLLGIISSIVEDGWAPRLIFVLLVGAAVFAVGLSIAFIFSAINNPLRRRLAGLKQPVSWQLTDSTDSKIASSSTAAQRSMKKLSEYVQPKGKNANSKIKQQLIRAGLRNDSAYGSFFAVKTIVFVAVSAIALVVIRWFPELTPMEAMIYVAVAGYIGFIIPNMVLDQIEKRRVHSIRHAFPDALDLFVVCVESGLGLTATIQRVAKEINISHPELAEELHLVSSEMRLGIDRIDALKGLTVRTGLDEIRGLVALIDQSVRFGTGIAETLRVYSEEFRDKRMQLAEEEAAKIGTKLIFPLTLCIWPGFFLVMIGPAILGVLEAIK